MIATIRMMKGVDRVALTTNPTVRFSQGRGISPPEDVTANSTPRGIPPTQASSPDNPII